MAVVDDPRVASARCLGCSSIALAPLLVASSTLATRRWGSRIGGLVSAFPAVVGPVLLITAEQMGAAAAQRAARGTLLGLVALSGFIAVYARLAAAGWRVSLAAAWASAALLGIFAASGARVGTVVAVASAAISLLAAGLLLPDAG